MDNFPSHNKQMQQPYIVPLCTKDVSIIHRDEHFLIVDKPEFLLSVPGRHALNKDCMITRIQQHYPSARAVHRLDLDTSGIMIVPLTRTAHSHISRQFQERMTEKTYIAIVNGIVKQDKGSIDLAIAADWENRPKQKICAQYGKHALTHYAVQSRDSNAQTTRLLLRPITGRSHQLRIHCRELGHPILGCDMYAPEDVLAMSKRLLLHASSIAFTHPISGEWLHYCSKPAF